MATKYGKFLMFTHQVRKQMVLNKKAEEHQASLVTLVVVIFLIILAAAFIYYLYTLKGRLAP